MTNRHYTIPPEQVIVACPEAAGPMEARAALLEAASYARRASLGGVLVILFAAFFVAFSLMFTSLIPPGAPSIFYTLPTVFALIGAGVGAYSIMLSMRRRRLARLLEEAALLVERGLLDPGKVCGASAGTVARIVASTRGSVKGV